MAPLLHNIRAISAAGQLMKRRLELPLRNIKTWSDSVPFEIDALGLITLLGAEEVSAAIGNLQRRRLTEALPLLAAFILAGDRFTSVQPGFAMYNLSDGITTSELRGWFTRWLMCEDAKNATTVFEWKRRTERRRSGISPIALGVSWCCVIPLIILTILMEDWYGVCNACAITVSIATRLYILGQQRLARDQLAESSTFLKSDEVKTLCITRSDGKMVTVKAPYSLLRTFYMTHDVESPIRYRVARYLAWVALGVHMLILGMCTLVVQIYTVVLLVCSTVAMCLQFNADFDRQHQLSGFKDCGEPQDEVVRIGFNDYWDIIKTNPTLPGSHVSSTALDRRQIAWARIGPNEWQEETMKLWNLLPSTGNRHWWQEYQRYKDILHPANDKVQSALESQADDHRPANSTAHAIAPFPHISPPGQNGNCSAAPSLDLSRSPSPVNEGGEHAVSASEF
jgi:hypothetical protein